MGGLADSIYSDSGKALGHYTQIIWKVTIGCVSTVQQEITEDSLQTTFSRPPKPRLSAPLVRRHRHRRRMTGSQDYHETKILQLAEKIKLIETIQNYLPVVPSPILQEMFKQTSYNKIKNINLEPVFYQIDSLLDNLSQSLLEQDLYIPYVAGINIWNNLIFGNLP